MEDKKNPPHVLAMLICLVLVLGLNVSCLLLTTRSPWPIVYLHSFETIFSTNFFIWLVSDLPGFDVRKTDTTGSNSETLPVSGAPEHGVVIPTENAGTNSPLRVGLAAGGAEPAVDVAAEEPRLILVGGTTAQILNLGTNTPGAQVQLTGQFAIRVAVSGDGAFAAVIVGQSNGPDGVDIIDLSSMTRTGTIELPTDCKARGIAFIPGTNDFAVACSGDGAVRFYSVNGGAGSAQIREFTGCEGARALVFTADGQRGLFSCTSSVWVYDVLSDSVVHKIEGFDRVQAMATTMHATRAYVTNTGDGFAELIVVHLATYGIVRTTEVGGFPGTVVVGPDDLSPHFQFGV